MLRSSVLYLLSIAIMMGILFLNPQIPSDYGVGMVVVSILAIILLSVFGLFAKSLMNYLACSILIQLAYFFLDLSTAVLIGKSLWFAVIQFINFVIVVTPFLLFFYLFHRTLKKKLFIEYAGLYKKNQLLVLALCIIALSSGGMPGFNVFVGEFMIYSSLFAIHPFLTYFAVLAGLVCFFFYFRICYTLLVGNSKRVVYHSLPMKIVLVLFTTLSVVLGVVPQILFYVLEFYI
ncbi:MAG: proton-conducting transporter membrane subunit [Candidatus Micrarchaeota archaeon]